MKTITDNLCSQDSWIGRSFDDYVHKKDLITFKSFHRTPDDNKEGII